jgi:hypothetical protein
VEMGIVVRKPVFRRTRGRDFVGKPRWNSGIDVKLRVAPSTSKEAQNEEHHKHSNTKQGSASISTTVYIELHHPTT